MEIPSRVRQEVRKAIVPAFTPEHKNWLKTTRKGERDALNQAMMGKSQIPQKRQQPWLNHALTTG